MGRRLVRAAIALGVVALAAVGGTAGVRAMKAREAAPSSGMAGMPGMAAGEHAPAAPAGASSKAVFISSARQQLIGVRSAPVARQHADGTLPGSSIETSQRILQTQNKLIREVPEVAAPMVGGVVTSFILELLIYPVIFTDWKWWRDLKPALARAGRETTPTTEQTAEAPS